MDRKDDGKRIILHRLFGAGGGGRTRTSLRTRDFESRASANSTTPAYLHKEDYITTRGKNQYVFHKKIKKTKNSENRIVFF